MSAIARILPTFYDCFTSTYEASYKKLGASGVILCALTAIPYALYSSVYTMVQNIQYTKEKQNGIDSPDRTYLKPWQSNRQYTNANVWAKWVEPFLTGTVYSPVDEGITTHYGFAPDGGNTLVHTVVPGSSPNETRTSHRNNLGGECSAQIGGSSVLAGNGSAFFNTRSGVDNQVQRLSKNPVGLFGKRDSTKTNGEFSKACTENLGNGF